MIRHGLTNYERKDEISMEPKNTMEVTTDVMQETAKANWMLRCGDFIMRNTGNIVAVMMAASMIGRVALAAPDGGADAMWNTIIDIVTKWVFRRGGGRLI